jgi:hypothetical protein
MRLNNISWVFGHHIVLRWNGIHFASQKRKVMDIWSMLLFSEWNSDWLDGWFYIQKNFVINEEMSSKSLTNCGNWLIFDHSLSHLLYCIIDAVIPKVNAPIVKALNPMMTRGEAEASCKV